MGKISISANQKRKLRNNGALVVMLPDSSGQKTATYYNEYGDALPGLPADPASLQMYMQVKRYTLRPPAHPLPRPEVPGLDKTQADWHGEKQHIQEDGMPYEGDEVDGPVATYYTAEGTAVPDLPADPENMGKFLALGLSLDPPHGAEAQEATA